MISGPERSFNPSRVGSRKRKPLVAHENVISVINPTIENHSSCVELVGAGDQSEIETVS